VCTRLSELLVALQHFVQLYISPLQLLPPTSRRLRN
jgi:hypothetical protein